MSDPQLSQLSPLQKATLALKRLRKRVDELETAAQEPIAVIGVAARFPGAPDKDAFWSLLEQGQDATDEIPSERWDVDAYYDPIPGTPGKMYCRRGGFIDGVDLFDPQFFRIAPREALGIDPQQRLLLESCWLALEDAGLVPSQLVGSDTGVFLGISTNDYGQVLSQTAESSSNNAQAGAGNAASVASGRISYSFGFQGPCVAVDTACSSSLVATHLAVRALRNRECRIGLVAGINLMLAPEITINFCQGGMLSPDGRCKTFDASADGYARGEGCGVLVLKRLSDARADGDRVLALIRGSAVNHDGRSSGLTAPNGRAQKTVIEKALADAGLKPGQISYVEAHGTGTELGDPIEMQALAEVFAAGRTSDAPLRIGSVKSNIGHLEAAAGVSAMIKMVLALSHGRIPANCNFKTLNPHIDVHDFNFEVPTQTLDWPAIDGRRIAGVSSFGFSGTNVHVLLETAPDEAPDGGEETEGERLLCLSARDPEALRELAAAYQSYLLTSEHNWARICGTVLTRRTQFNERLAVTAGDKRQAADNLAAFLAGTHEPSVSQATVTRSPPPIAFLFTGQGSLHQGMARALYEHEPVFRATIERCAELSKDRLDRALTELLLEADESILTQTQYAQPALFAFQIALSELWASWGVTPAAVIGHSVGELAAACVAGCFDLEAGLAFACERGRLMQALPEGGVMMALLTDPDSVYLAVQECGEELVSVAAENGPDSTVIAGSADAVQRVTDSLAQQGVEHSRLAVSHAFHSPLIEACLDELELAAAKLPDREAAIDLISNVTAEPLRRLDQAYWRRHARYPVLFAEGLATASRLGCGTYIEIGPHAVLTGLGRRTGIKGAWLSSLRRDSEARHTLLQCVGQLWSLGYPLHWNSIFSGPTLAPVSLPGYPFQRERYWPETVAPSPAMRALPADAHPLLGSALRLPLSREQRFESWIDTQRLPFLADHRVYDVAILPGAGLIEILNAAGHSLAGGQRCVIEDLRIDKPLRLDHGAQSVQLIAQPDAHGGWECNFVSLCGADATDDSSIQRHARARLVVATGVESDAPNKQVDPGALDHELAVDAFYAGFAERGLNYGPAFRGVQRLWRTPQGAYAELAAPESIKDDLARYRAHPALLDAALQVLAAALPESPGEDAFLPVGISKVSILNDLPEQLFCHARAVRDGDRVSADITLSDEARYPLLRVEGLTLLRAPANRLLSDHDTRLDWLYQIEWRPAPAAPITPAPDFLPAPATLVPALASRARQLAEQEGLADYAALEPEQDRLAVAYIVSTLRRLGAELEIGERFTSNGLAEELEVADQHRRLFGRMLDILGEENLLERQGHLWTVSAEMPAGDTDADCAALIARFPACGAELGLLRRAGAALHTVLRGESDPLTLLFPAAQAGEEGASELYAESIYARIVNRLLADAVRELVASLPAERSLRVLEIGAGTGGTTRTVLPELDAHRSHYDFTDVSSWFESQARPLFEKWPWLRFQLLDIEQPPLRQGFTAGAYDLIVAANVLHATRDLTESLSHLRTLLAPGGMLLLIESTAKRRWVDLVFGMTEGWWRFQDSDLRPDHPLLSGPQWVELLTSVGFEDAHSLPGGELILARNAADALPDRGDWLLIGGGEEIASSLAERMHAAGARCRLFDVDSLESLQACFDDENNPDWAGMVHLGGLESLSGDVDADVASVMAWQQRICGGALGAARQLAATGSNGRLRLITGRGNGMSETMSATIRGLGNTVMLEHPELHCRHLEIDPSSLDLNTLCMEILSEAREDRLRLRGKERHVARLTRLSDTDTGSETAIRADASYLITGGLGGLGLAVARWLVGRGARHLILLARSEPTAATHALLEELRQEGARLEIRSLDVADATALKSLFVEFGTQLPPLAGVVHAAGKLDNSPLREQNWTRFENVFRAKVAGAWNLHQLTRDLDLDFFVLFSSMAGVLGSGGQANHAAAATFLDALSAARRAQDLPCVSLDWGAWSQVGAAAKKEVVRQMEQAGLGTISPEQGIALFAWALGQPVNRVPCQALVLPDVDWRRFAGQFPGADTPALYSELMDQEATQKTTEQVGDSSATGRGLPATLRAADETERRALLIAHLAREVAAVIGLKTPPPQDTPLPELGFDSLMAVELKNRIESALPTEFPVRRILEGASLAILADELLRTLDLNAHEDTSNYTPARRIEPDPANRHQPFPLTDIQQAYWVGRGPGMALGGIGCHLYMEIEGDDIPLESLQDAWRRLVARHDMLRAVITEDNQQRILQQVPDYEIQVLDLSHLDNEERDRRLQTLRVELSHHVFDATRWPLFDIRATRLDDHRTRLHLGFDLLVLDAASIFQLREEWIALAADPALLFPPLDISFRDLVLAEVAHQQSPAYERAEAYWLERLPTLPGGPELPLVKDPASISRPHFERHMHQLDAAPWSRLKARAQRAGLTPSGLLCAAYAEILAAWSRRAHFCLTLTLFNRPALHPQVASLVGDFTSTVLLEFDASLPTFDERAAALARRLAADLDHSAFSGVRVMREQARRSSVAATAVPVVFTSALGVGTETADGPTSNRIGEMIYSVAQTPQVLLDHQASEQNGGLIFTWDLIEELFPPQVPERMFQAYCRLLESLADEENAWRARIADRLPDEEFIERRRANDSDGPKPQGLLHAPFLAHAAQAPERLAIVDGEKRLSYGELLRHAGGVAAALQERGVETDELVAVVMHKGWQQVAAVLGILGAGAAYLPIDAALPDERRRLLLSDGAVRIALIDWMQENDHETTSAWPEGVEAIHVETLPMAAMPPPACTPDDLAYVIYTSGSTGMPKGVMIEHKAALNTVMDINQRFAVGPEDRVLALASLSFDLSVYDVFGVLGAGGALIFPGADGNRDPRRWVDLIRAHGITLWNSVPALMAMLCEFGEALGDDLRLVLMSGDWIPLDLPERIPRIAPKARMVGLGGATEASIWSNYHEITQVEADWRSIPYGRPLTNQTFAVLNDRLEPCPVWLSGDLYIGGHGLARGYWHAPELSAQRFFQHPVSGERLYATGDHGRYLPNGEIEFLGREDHQVKIRGYRIELGEIEAMLARHPEVQNAIVVTTGASRNNLGLAAFVVAESAADTLRPAPASGWESMLHAGHERAKTLAGALDAAEFEAVRAPLERLYLDAVASALMRLGAFSNAEQPETVESLIHDYGVAPRYRQWLKRALNALTADGMLNASDGGYRASKPLPDTVAEITAIQSADKFGFSTNDFALLQRVVDRLDDLITERVHSADIYTADETPEIYRVLFQFTLPVVGDMVAALAQSGQPLRVLEVGAGLGTTTREVLSRLPEDTQRFVFSDISRYFIETGRRAFSDYPFVEFERLDLENSPAEQNFAGRDFDLIIASSVLHATRDVTESLIHIRRMLAPDGLLLLVEETRFHPWYDLSMGLQQGFDCFTDHHLRRDHPLLDRESWLRLLTDTGFARGEILTAPGGIAEMLGFEILLAGAPAQGTPVDAEQLRTFLTQHLPTHMVPADIVLLDALPLTGNGKIDRAKLERLGEQGSKSLGAKPETTLEKKVAAIFAELTGAVYVARDDSFFSLGGNSLAMVQLYNRLTQDLGGNFEVAELFRTPEVSAVAALIERTAAIVPAAASALVELKRGRAVPLFIVPGVVAAPYYLNALAERLEPDQGLFSFQAPGLDGGLPLDTIEAQASHYLHALRAVQPDGPYRIAGHSYGGYVAFEMARQLTLAGEEVELLGLLDTLVVRSRLSEFQSDEIASEAIVRAFYALYEDRFSEPYEQLRERPLGEQLERVMAQLQEHGLVTSDTLVEGVKQVFKANFRAMAAYQLQAYEGPMFVVRSEGGFPEEMSRYESGESLADHALGWSQYCANVRTLSVEGDHLQMMNPPFIDKLARLLNTELHSETTFI